MEDKVAIVTGGASGLGLGIAQGLLADGAKVIVLDIDEEKLSKISKEFITYNVDITDYKKVEELIVKIVTEFNKIDILVNNAGILHSEALVNFTKPGDMKHSYENYKKVIDVVQNSVFILGSIVSEQMVKKRTKGVIVNISSISANGNAGQTAYSAAKAAVNAMTKVWAKELGLMGIRVVAIAPGFINTESTRSAITEDIIKNIEVATPLRSLGKTKNIVDAVRFVIENDFVNGTVVEVDGGLTI